MGLRSGCPPAEEFEQLLHPDDLAGFLAAMGRAFKQAERTHHRCRMFHLDGNVRFIDVHLKVSRDKLGKPMRMLGMLKDVTADVEAARQLQATPRSRAAAARAAERRDPGRRAPVLGVLVHRGKLHVGG